MSLGLPNPNPGRRHDSRTGGMPNPDNTKLVTNCKLCPGGVYKGQAWAWNTDPVGICHQECIDAKVNASTQEAA